MASRAGLCIRFTFSSLFVFVALSMQRNSPRPVIQPSSSSAAPLTPAPPPPEEPQEDVIVRSHPGWYIHIYAFMFLYIYLFLYVCMMYTLVVSMEGEQRVRLNY